MRLDLDQEEGGMETGWGAAEAGSGLVTGSALCLLPIPSHSPGVPVGVGVRRIRLRCGQGQGDFKTSTYVAVGLF